MCDLSSKPLFSNRVSVVVVIRLAVSHLAWFLLQRLELVLGFLVTEFRVGVRVSCDRI